VHDRADKTHSVNFILPDEWLTAGTIDLTARVEAPAGRPERRVDNNTERRTISFIELEGTPKPWTIEYLRVCYEPPGQPRTATADSQVGALDQFVRKLFPIAAKNLRYAPFHTPCAVWPSEITDENYTQFTAWLRKFYETIQPAVGAPVQLAGWVEQLRIGLAGASDPGVSGTARVSWLLHDRSLGPSYNAYNLAHQIGLNLGRRRPNTEDACGARDAATDWRRGEPDERRLTARTLEVGFDPETGEAKSGDKFDLMSYCSTGDNIWISPFTYRRLIDGRLQFGPGNTPAADAIDLIISGVVARDGSSGRLDSAYRVPAAGRLADPTLPSNHSIRLSSDTETLAESRFMLRFQHARDGRDLASEAFTVRVPFIQGTRKVSLMRGDTEIATLLSDPAGPQISFVSPSTGVKWEGGGERTLSWSASHPGGKPLTYLVQYSADGGRSWLPLAVDLRQTEFRFNIAEISGGDVLFKVVASSGLDNAEAVTGPIQIVQVPRIEAAPADLAFRKVLLGETKTLPVVLRNSGTGRLDIRNVMVDSTAYRIATGPGLEIPAGSERTIMVEYRPTTEAEHAAAVIVDSSDPATPAVRLPLLGRGIRTMVPDVEVSPQTLGFGAVTVGQTKEMTFAVRNYGPGILSVSDAVTSHARYVIVDPPPPFQVPANGERQVTVRFFPNNGGDANGELRLSTNDPQRLSIPVALSGSGAVVGPPPGEENPAPVLRSLSPGSVVAGSPGFTLTVTGSAFLPVSVVEWNGAARATSFVSAAELRATITAADIASAGTSVVTVFNPAPGGGRSLSLAFRMDSPTPPPPPPGPSVLIQQFRLTACPDVTAFVSILDENDATIPRLNAGNLNCTEDGSPVRCTFSSAVTEPVSVAIVVGLNGLNAVDADVAKAAARVIVNSLNPGDRAAIVHMESVANPVMSFTSDRTTLLATIDAIRAVGSDNALFDAVALGGSMAASEIGRRQAVFVLAPNDNTGGTVVTADQAISRATAGGVPFFAAGFGPGAANVPLADFLRRLARETSGRAVNEARIGDIQQRMRQYWQILAGQYTLSYSSGIASRNRTLGVNFVAPGRSASAVRSYAGCR
jgi:hypothetical protein